MAVYTTVSDAALASFLADYDLGEAVAFKGIAEGVENSNYYLETTAGRYILTLFEKRANPDDLPYFIALKQHLSEHGFSCPLPVAAKDGAALRTLSGRPAVIVTFLQGLSPRVPNARQCRELGAGLAALHQASASFSKARENDLGPSSWPKLWQGRAPVAEAFLATRAFSDAVRGSAPSEATLAALTGATPLHEAALALAARGTISLDEALRVAPPALP